MSHRARYSLLTRTLLATLVALAATLGVAPRDARANGLVTHTHLADQAVLALRPSPLRDIMADPSLREAYRNGSIYPDTGYALDHPYGEWSHWEPFIEAYVQYIRTQHPAPFTTAEARYHVAFLMGCAAHVMADQVFDMLFMARTREIDGTTDNLDIGSDSWLVVEHGYNPVAEGTMPTRDLIAINASVQGPAITDQLVRDATSRTLVGMRAIANFAHSFYDTHWREMRWAATHYMDRRVPGSFPVLSDVIARYWEVLWERLNGRQRPDASAILFTYPADGEVNVPTDPATINTRFTVIFGYGVDHTTVNEQNLRLLGPGDTVVPASVGIYASEWGNTLTVRPRAPLANDTLYRVELGTGLRTIDRAAITAPLRFAFRTRCAEGRESDCPALPAQWVAPENPPITNPRMPRRDAGIVDVQTTPVVPDAGAMDAAAADVTPGGECGGLGGSGTGCSCATTPARTHGGRTGALLGGLLAVLAGARIRRARRQSE